MLWMYRGNQENIRNCIAIFNFIVAQQPIQRGRIRRPGTSKTGSLKAIPSRDEGSERQEHPETKGSQMNDQGPSRDEGSENQEHPETKALKIRGGPRRIRRPGASRDEVCENQRRPKTKGVKA